MNYNCYFCDSTLTHQSSTSSSNRYYCKSCGERPYSYSLWQYKCCIFTFDEEINIISLYFSNIDQHIDFWVWGRGISILFFEKGFLYDHKELDYYIDPYDYSLEELEFKIKQWIALS